MGRSFVSLLWKDFKMMAASSFFLLALGSLILYSCYIHFVYAGIDQEAFPIYLYDPYQTLENAPSEVQRMESVEEMQTVCGDGYGVGIDLSGGRPRIYMVSCGWERLDNCRYAYAVSGLKASGHKRAQIIGTNSREMKNRREMTAECLFFELAAVGFLGLAAMLYKEKQMGVIRVHGVLPIRKSAFIVSKLLLVLMLDLVFATALTLLNLGATAGLAVLPAVLPNAGILSLLMALIGFLCAVRLPDFKQFSLLYLVLAVFITTPVFLAGQTGIAPQWINYHPMYYLFMAIKNAYFHRESMGSLYYAVCAGAAALLFFAARRGLIHEMAEEG